MISDFSALCKRKARDQDKVIFNDWERGKISTEECLKMFFNHNECYTDYSADDLTAFAWWLRGLGYIRRYKL